MQKTIFKLFILILIISACSTNKILSKKNQMNKLGRADQHLSLNYKVNNLFSFLDCIKHCQTAKIMNPECNCLLKKEEKKISIKDQGNLFDIILIFFCRKFKFNFNY